MSKEVITSDLVFFITNTPSASVLDCEDFNKKESCASLLLSGESAECGKISIAVCAIYQMTMHLCVAIYLIYKPLDKSFTSVYNLQ